MLNLGFQGLGQKTAVWFRDFAAGSGEEGIKCGVEHADYFRGLVGDYRFVDFIPEDGDGVAAGIGGVSFEVELGELFKAVEGVDWVCVVAACESPGGALSVV